MTPTHRAHDPAHRVRVTLRALNTRVGVWPRLLFLGQLRDPATQCCSLPEQTPQVGTCQQPSQPLGPQAPAGQRPAHLVR